MNTSPLHHPSDADLDEALARSFDAAEPVPDDAVALAYAAATFDDLIEELAALAFDSSASDALVAMRTHQSDTRMLSFSTGDVTIDLEIRHHDGVIVGEVSPGSVDDEVVAEAIDGSSVTARLDEHGRFRIVIHDRVLRLRIVGKVVTPWITA